MTSPGISCILRTVSHLRWSQILWRGRRALGRALGGGRAPEVPRKFTDAGPPVRGDVPAVPAPVAPQAGDAQPVDLARRGEVEHLGERRTVGIENPDWGLGPVSQGRLWTATLHYHEWAFALAKAGAGDLFKLYVSDWISRCEPGHGGAADLAWNPFVIATRISWWSRSHAALGREWWDAEPEFRKIFLTSLWRQAAYLERHIEWDLRGNHLMRDAVGLAWAGRFFEGDDARGWLRTAAEIASAQVDEQVLPDGGHFERSPMYHVQVMGDLLALALLLEDEPAAGKMRAAWGRMAEWLRWMQHPDGGIPLLNDSALNGACEPGAMLELGGQIGATFAEPAPSGGRHFAESGTVAWRGDPWTVFFDAGPLGPDYQPGHGHADTLAVECSWRGRRLFVDAGTCSYDEDDRRRYDRSTAAHNTVCVDGTDSSEMWKIFRVGRRAKPKRVEVDTGAGPLRASAAHDGYRHLRGRPEHSREVSIDSDGTLGIVDRVEGRRRHAIEGGLLLGPGWEVADAAGGWEISGDAGRVRVSIEGHEGLSLRREDRACHPEFGLEVMRPRLVWRVEAELPVKIVTRITGER